MYESLIGTSFPAGLSTQISSGFDPLTTCLAETKKTLFAVPSVKPVPQTVTGASSIPVRKITGWMHCCSVS